MKHCLAIKIREILPFVTTWMGLEDIMLGEICQTEKGNYYVIYLYVEIKKQNKIPPIRKVQIVVTRDRGWGKRKLEEGGQKV